MSILVYKMFFHTEFSNVLSKMEEDIVFFSSERRLDDSGVIDNYYKVAKEANISIELVTDIIIRCRYLSGINFFDAKLKVRKMWAAVEEYYDNNSVELVMAPPVDNYVVDIWFKIASLRKIPAFQPRKSPLPGLMRITNSTDNPVLREPGDDEVEAALKHLGRNFKADYQNTKVRNSRQIAMKAAREIIKKFYFEYWKIKFSDPDSFHYNAIFPNKNAITIKSPSQLWYCKKFVSTVDDALKVKNKFKKVVFWPLAMAPESALCYLNADCTFSDYRDVIGKVVDAVSDDALLIVKEHPSAIGYRDVKHYSKLFSKDNIMVCNPAESTGKIIELVDSVLINTSSTTGLEAVAFGKPVLAIGSCHYKVPGVVDEIKHLADIYDWASRIRTKPLEHEEAKLVLHKYLSNTISDAAWAMDDVGEKWYASGVRKSLLRCVELKESGYIPEYHS